MEKTCTKCDEKKCLGFFPRDKSTKDGFHPSCKSCRKAAKRLSYLKHKDEIIDKQRERRRATQDWWEEYKRQFSCSKCGEDHPACIQFHHHNDDKEATVSWLVHNNVCKERILKEIAKCISLCANCHFKEHWKKKAHSSSGQDITLSRLKQGSDSPMGHL